MKIKLSEKQQKEGWRIVKFCEIARNVSDRVDPSKTDLEIYVGLEHIDPQSLRITRRGVPADVKGQKLRVRPGQIIFGKRRAYQKKLAVADFDGICSAHAMVLEEVPGKITSGLLPFFMHSDKFMNRAIAISEGSLSPTIKWKTLAIQKFPLPPIERQKELLEVLSKIEECSKKVESTHASGIFSLYRVMNSFIDSICERTNKKPLGEMGCTYAGLSGKKGSDFGEGQPYITYLNVYNNYQLNPTMIDYVRLKPKEKQNCVKEKDVIFTTSSETPHEVGMSSVLTEDLGEVYLNSFCFGFRFNDPKQFYTQYLKYFFRSNFFRKKLRRLAQGSTRYNLSKKEFLKIKIPVPNFENQLQIAEVLELQACANNHLKSKILFFSSIKRSVLNILTNGGGVK